MFAVVGCGEEKATETEEEVSEGTLPEIPDVEAEDKKQQLQDCIGYDFGNIPRYPDCRRIGFWNEQGFTHIEYETTDSVQDVANYYISALPGWEITKNSEERFTSEHRDSEHGSSNQIDIGETPEMDGNKVSICCYEEQWRKLKSGDPTVEIKNYNTEPETDIVADVKNHKEIAGNDIGTTRPDNPDTVRTKYMTRMNETNVEYLTAEPFGPLVIEYLTKGYGIVDSERNSATLTPKGSMYPRVHIEDSYSSTSPTEVKVRTIEGY